MQAADIALSCEEGQNAKRLDAIRAQQIADDGIAFLFDNVGNIVGLARLERQTGRRLVKRNGIVRLAQDRTIGVQNVETEHPLLGVEKSQGDEVEGDELVEAAAEIGE